MHLVYGCNFIACWSPLCKKFTSIKPNSTFCILRYFMHLIHARNMEDIKNLFQIHVKNTLLSTITSPNYTFPQLHIHFSSSLSVLYVPQNTTPFIWRSWYYSVQQYKLPSLLFHFLHFAAISSLLILNVLHFTLLSNNFLKNEHSQKK
jgi:hypothetical protein